MDVTDSKLNIVGYKTVLKLSVLLRTTTIINVTGINDNSINRPTIIIIIIIIIIIKYNDIELIHPHLLVKCTKK